MVKSMFLHNRNWNGSNGGKALTSSTATRNGSTNETNHSSNATSTSADSDTGISAPENHSTVSPSAHNMWHMKKRSPDTSPLTIRTGSNSTPRGSGATSISSGDMSRARGFEENPLSNRNIPSRTALECDGKSLTLCLGADLSPSLRLIAAGHCGHSNQKAVTPTKIYMEGLGNDDRSSHPGNGEANRRGELSRSAMNKKLVDGNQNHNVVHLREEGLFALLPPEICVLIGEYAISTVSDLLYLVVASPLTFRTVCMQHLRSTLGSCRHYCSGISRTWVGQYAQHGRNFMESSDRDVEFHNTLTFYETGDRQLLIMALMEATREHRKAAGQVGKNQAGILRRNENSKGDLNPDDVLDWSNGVVIGAINAGQRPSSSTGRNSQSPTGASLPASSSSLPPSSGLPPVSAVPNSNTTWLVSFADPSEPWGTINPTLLQNNTMSPSAASGYSSHYAGPFFSATNTTTNVYFSGQTTNTTTKALATEDIYLESSMSNCTCTCNGNFGQTPLRKKRDSLIMGNSGDLIMNGVVDFSPSGISGGKFPSINTNTAGISLPGDTILTTAGMSHSMINTGACLGALMNNDSLNGAVVNSLNHSNCDLNIVQSPLNEYYYDDDGPQNPNMNITYDSIPDSDTDPVLSQFLKDYLQGNSSESCEENDRRNAHNIVRSASEERMKFAASEERKKAGVDGKIDFKSDLSVDSSAAGFSAAGLPVGLPVVPSGQSLQMSESMEKLYSAERGILNQIDADGPLTPTTPARSSAYTPRRSTAADSVRSETHESRTESRADMSRNISREMTTEQTPRDSSPEKSLSKVSDVTREAHLNIDISSSEEYRAKFNGALGTNINGALGTNIKGALGTNINGALGTNINGALGTDTAMPCGKGEDASTAPNASGPPKLRTYGEEPLLLLLNLFLENPRLSSQLESLGDISLKKPETHEINAWVNMNRRLMEMQLWQGLDHSQIDILEKEIKILRMKIRPSPGSVTSNRLQSSGGRSSSSQTRRSLSDSSFLDPNANSDSSEGLGSVNHSVNATNNSDIGSDSATYNNISGANYHPIHGIEMSKRGYFDSNPLLDCITTPDRNSLISYGDFRSSMRMNDAYTTMNSAASNPYTNMPYANPMMNSPSHGNPNSTVSRIGGLNKGSTHANPMFNNSSRFDEFVLALKEHQLHLLKVTEKASEKIQQDPYPYSHGNNPRPYINAQQDKALRAFSRSLPCVFSCKKCKTPLLDSRDVLSAHYRLAAGKAFLTQRAYNVWENSAESFKCTYTTGIYDVRDVHCGHCQTYLGIRYLSGGNTANQYKIGKLLMAQDVVTVLGCCAAQTVECLNAHSSGPIQREANEKKSTSKSSGGPNHGGHDPPHQDTDPATLSSIGRLLVRNSLNIRSLHEMRVQQDVEMRTAEQRMLSRNSQLSPTASSSIPRAQTNSRTPLLARSNAVGTTAASTASTVRGGESVAHAATNSTANAVRATDNTVLKRYRMGNPVGNRLSFFGRSNNVTAIASIGSAFEVNPLIPMANVNSGTSIPGSNSSMAPNSISGTTHTDFAGNSTHANARSSAHSHVSLSACPTGTENISAHGNAMGMPSAIEDDAIPAHYNESDQLLARNGPPMSLVPLSNAFIARNARGNGNGSNTLTSGDNQGAGPSIGSGRNTSSCVNNNESCPICRLRLWYDSLVLVVALTRGLTPEQTSQLIEMCRAQKLCLDLQNAIKERKEVVKEDGFTSKLKQIMFGKWRSGNGSSADSLPLIGNALGSCAPSSRIFSNNTRSSSASLSASAASTAYLTNQERRNGDQSRNARASDQNSRNGNADSHHPGGTSQTQTTGGGMARTRNFGMPANMLISIPQTSCFSEMIKKIVTGFFIPLESHLENQDSSRTNLLEINNGRFGMGGISGMNIIGSGNANGNSSSSSGFGGQNGFGVQSSMYIGSMGTQNALTNGPINLPIVGHSAMNTGGQSSRSVLDDRKESKQSKESRSSRDLLNDLSSGLSRGVSKDSMVFWSKRRSRSKSSGSKKNVATFELATVENIQVLRRYAMRQFVGLFPEPKNPLSIRRIVLTANILARGVHGGNQNEKGRGKDINGQNNIAVVTPQDRQTLFLEILSVIACKNIVYNQVYGNHGIFESQFPNFESQFVGRSLDHTTKPEISVQIESEQGRRDILLDYILREGDGGVANFVVPLLTGAEKCWR